MKIILLKNDFRTVPSGGDWSLYRGGAIVC